jgi:hypothetical protein
MKEQKAWLSLEVRVFEGLWDDDQLSRAFKMLEEEVKVHVVVPPSVWFTAVLEQYKREDADITSLLTDMVHGPTQSVKDLNHFPRFWVIPVHKRNHWTVVVLDTVKYTVRNMCSVGAGLSKDEESVISRVALAIQGRHHKLFLQKDQKAWTFKKLVMVKGYMDITHLHCALACVAFAYGEIKGLKWRSNVVERTKQWILQRVQLVSLNLLISSMINFA